MQLFMLITLYQLKNKKNFNTNNVINVVMEFIINNICKIYVKKQ